MGHQAADLAHRLARDAEAVCRHYLSNGRREGRYWLVGDVHNTPGRSLFVRLRGPGIGQGRRWQMDGRGDRRAWRSARHHPRKLRFRPILRRRRRGTAVPQPATTRPGAKPCSAVIFSAGGIARVGKAALRNVPADCGHNRRNVFTPTRHYGFARNRQSPFPSTLLLPA